MSKWNVRKAKVTAYSTGPLVCSSLEYVIRRSEKLGLRKGFGEPVIMKNTLCASTNVAEALTCKIFNCTLIESMKNLICSNHIRN